MNSNINDSENKIRNNKIVLRYLLFIIGLFIASMGVAFSNALSAVICLVFLGRLEGVREGSIVAAILVGNIIKIYSKLFDMLVRRGESNM